MMVFARFAAVCVVVGLVTGCTESSSTPPAGGGAGSTTGGSAGIPATPSRPPAAPAGPTRHQGTGFSLEVPTGWKVFTAPGSFTLYPDGRSGDASMGVTMIAYPPGTAADTYLTKQTSFAISQTGNLEATGATIAGHPALRRVFVFDPTKGTAADRLSYDIATPKGVYYVICTVKNADEFATILPVYEQIVNSMKFE